MKYYLALLLSISFLCCKKEQDQRSPEKSITAFSFKASSNPGVLAIDVSGVINGDTILLGVPPTVSFVKLVPSITHTGQSVSPASEQAQNFSSTLTYTVTAANRSTKNYIVKAYALSNNKSILSFGFKASDNPGLLTQDANGVINGDTVLITVDAQNLAGLTPSITHNGKSISPTNSSTIDFKQPVAYTVIAEDGSTKKYVIVTKSASTVFVTDRNQYLYSFDGATGKLRWRKALRLSQIAAPAFENGNVYIGNDNFLVALDGATGQLKWQTDLKGNAVTSAQVVNGIVYIAGQRGSPTSFVTAIDATNGTIKWDRLFSAEVLTSNLTVAEGKVVIGTFPSGLYCFDATSGTQMWRARIGMIRDNPALINGTVYIGSEHYKVIALDATTGLQKWVVRTENLGGGYYDHGIGSSPSLHKGVLYTGAFGAYDTATGTLKWKYLVFNTAPINPVGENGVIYGTTLGDIVFALNSDGTLKWRYGTYGSTNNHIQTPSATVANGVLYTGCDLNNKLIALDAATGQLLWSYEGNAPFTSGSCVVDGKGKAHYGAVSGAHQ